MIPCSQGGVHPGDFLPSPDSWPLFMLLEGIRMDEGMARMEGGWCRRGERWGATEGGMKGGREAILDQRCVVLGSLCSLSHPTAGYYTHTRTHIYTQAKHNRDFHDNSVPASGSNKAGWPQCISHRGGEGESLTRAGPEESSAPLVRPQNQISRDWLQGQAGV